MRISFRHICSVPPTKLTTFRPYSQIDFNEYFHKDHGITFRDMKKKIYRPLAEYIELKEVERTRAQKAEIKTVAFTPPLVADEIVHHKAVRTNFIEQYKALPVEYKHHIDPAGMPRPAVSRRDGQGSCSGNGRRKTARAVANIRPGTGKIMVNGKNFADYFGSLYTRGIMLEPIIATEKYNVVDINVRAWGGGFSGQAAAIGQAIARALIRDDPENRFALRSIVKPDFRKKERKHTGLLKARKRPAWKRR